MNLCGFHPYCIRSRKKVTGNNNGLQIQMHDPTIISYLRCMGNGSKWATQHMGLPFLLQLVDNYIPPVDSKCVGD